MARPEPAPDPSIFPRYLLDRHPALHARHPPSLDRRASLLRIADEFWSLDARSWAALPSAAAANATTIVSPPGTGTPDAGDEPPPPPPPLASDSAQVVVAGDDHDHDHAVPVPPGIVLRTDYGEGSDDAWAAFCGALRAAEREFLADQDQPEPEPSVPGVERKDELAMDVDADGRAGSEGGSDDEETARGQGDDDEDDEDEDEPLALFSFVSDPASTRFDDISNLRALRLLFDVSVRAAPDSMAPPKSPRHQHQHQHRHRHRLKGLRGLQETYDARGRTLWIFDSRSRADGCARLVSAAGDVATGDSWRARATHMAELQANLAARTLRIDFGGLDGWDYAERQRNMQEADAGYAAIL
ncbi:hypothetical protein F5148DRAFT_339280 [Russula earlei]|uniref:Uncharacterized protein n=1 Tax=Russula earlei TaxID=71964 RepID=A0ACC0U1Y4_9AGAM|nr:hypothetical protein F5148DRAFT_339280 [Russula earlei]